MENETTSPNALSEYSTHINQNSGLLNQDTMNYLLSNIGAPFIIGLAVGYFAKKVLKMALFLGGMIIVGYFIAEYYGYFEMNDEGLKGLANSATNMAKDSGNFLVDRLAHITGRGVSAVVGFFTGLKFG